MIIKALKKTIIVGLALVALFSLTACPSNKAAIRRIEFYVEIELPNDMKVLYNYQPTGFRQGGRNPQYTVFQLEERPDEFLSENGFKSGTSPDEVFDFSSPGYKARHSPVPEEFYPPWDEEFLWFRIGSMVYLIYFEDQKLLIAMIEGS